MPDVVIIAGPNGSGKTTLAPALLQDVMHIDHFVNADAIAQGLSPFQPEKTAFQAGRIMLTHLHALAQSKVDFAFETTLASRTFFTWIQELKQQGYRFHLLFIWVYHVKLAIARVRERVDIGGHTIPTETIKRRYHAGLKNFFNLYQSIADSWQFYDNSTQTLTPIATFINGKLVTYQSQLWRRLMRNYAINAASLDTLKKLTPNPTVTLTNTEQLTRALQRGLVQNLRIHKKLDNAICQWRNQQVVWVQPREIKLDEDETFGT
jgi:predicted ABC-type ATPase